MSTKLCYAPRSFNPEQLDLIHAANTIIADYEPQGYGLSLRQLYYQFVARGLLENEQRNYNRLGALISDARMAGLVSWSAIEDRGRNLMGLDTFSDPLDALQQLRAKYYIDMWEDQPCRPEVWIEKQALEGVIGAICNELRVNFFATRGYNSQSEQWRAGQRFAGYIQKGQRPIVLHLGDHDPSGIDMTRDNEERLSLFAGVPILVKRIALNMDQIEELSPPPNPAKLSDSRAPGYIERFGDESWELDALDPTMLHDLIRDEVAKWREEKVWDDTLKVEATHKDELDIIIEDLKGEDDVA